MPQRSLFSFHGGIKPDSHKEASRHEAIRCVSLAPCLIIPLVSRTGGRPRPLVKPGQKVLKGERIGAADGLLSVAVHASTSGTVLDIRDAPLPHPSGLMGPCVLLEPDGKDEWMVLEPVPFPLSSPDVLRDALRDAGVVGLGGAVFPSHVKLNPGVGRRIDTLILNGAECEPYITCDDRLMQEATAEILGGALLMQHILGAKQILIGIEDNKPEAIAAFQALPLPSDVAIVAVPTRYPAGGEKQLIRVLTGLEIPHGVRPVDNGVQCFNVGTARAAYRAIHLGEPVVSRVLTVAGDVAVPSNIEVPIGTPMQHVVAQCRPGPTVDRYIMGGPMMGLVMPHFEVPVTKGCNCILASSPRLFPPAPPEQACIRCTECATVCPADLQPFELYWYSRARQFGKAQEYHLFDCIECGCCSYVCPSHIPLVDYFRFGKSEIWAREREKNQADQARVRFESRNARQEREKEEKAAKLAAKAAQTREKLAQGPSGLPAPEGSGIAVSPEDAKKALIAAALERARNAKASPSSEGGSPMDATELPLGSPTTSAEKST
jgi:Na+-translocating ferredoxin:NAD+ oxidoreductase subunit C